MHINMVAFGKPYVEPRLRGDTSGGEEMHRIADGWGLPGGLEPGDTPSEARVAQLLQYFKADRSIAIEWMQLTLEAISEGGHHHSCS